MSRISLEPTYGFQSQLEAALHGWSDDYQAQGSTSSLARITQAARDKVRQTGMVFEAKRELAVALSPLVLREDDLRRLQEVTEAIHVVVEKALTWVLADKQRLLKFFPDHARVFDYLVGTRGASTWQNISRYDAIITRDGSIKIIELNTACPAGFFHSSGMAAIAQELLRDISPSLARSLCWGGPIPRDALAQTLLSIERSAQLEPGLVALVNDENQLLNELALLQDQLVSMGRQAAIVPAESIRFEQGQAWYEAEPISVSFNKVRVSTERSPNHRWSSGFEQRYGGFLQAMMAQSFASINNLVALSIAEDKGLLALLHHPDFQDEITEDQRQRVQDHVLPTARLLEEEVYFDGRLQRIDQAAQRQPEQFVIKPANEGRGFGLNVGIHSTATQWQSACQLDADLPKVIQQYTEPAQIPVTCLRDEHTTPQRMYLTLGLAMMRGKFQGVLSRISTNPVTNISQSGLVQAVFLDANSKGSPSA